MTWTTEPPKEPGHYWWRIHNGAQYCRLCVEYVYETDSGMWVSVGYESYDAKTFGGEWWTERIKEPKS